MRLGISKKSLWKKISPKIRTLQRQCVLRNSHIKRHTQLEKTLLSVDQPRYNLRWLAMLKTKYEKC